MTFKEYQFLIRSDLSRYAFTNSNVEMSKNVFVR